jgi:putative transposase
MYFRVEEAFRAFFRKQNKFPRFKKKKEFVTQEYPSMYIKVIDGFHFILPTGKGFDNFKIQTCEAIPEKFTTLTITKKKDNFFACFTVEKEEITKRNNKEILAIDLGIKTLVTGFNNREFIEIDKFSHYTRHLDVLRSRRDKCKKKSGRYVKWSKILNRQTNNYLNRVNDYLHKASYWVTNKLPEKKIIVGDLNLEELKSCKTWFNRILFNEWRVSRFVDFLGYKCKLYGKELIKIDERGTTRTCSCCGNVKEMKLSDRVYKCENCGFELGRDKNSSINIMKKYCVANAVEFNFNVFAQARNLNINTFVYI